jgi:hypothetical protein
VKRRDFLKSTAVITGGGLLPRYGASAGGISSNAVPGARPNILFILVDELRYPTVYPDKIKTAGEFLAKFYAKPL